MPNHGNAQRYTMGQKIKFDRYQWFDPKGEHVFVLKDGRKKVECSYKTLVYCAKNDKDTPSGVPVRLRVCQTTRGLATTLEEFERFISALSGE